MSENRGKVVSMVTSGRWPAELEGREELAGLGPENEGLWW